MKRILAIAFVLALGVSAGARADQPATFTGPESAAEKAFIQAIQLDLGTRYPTAAAAEKAGYIRYTEMDDTGAISYANMQWTSSDDKHPSQLWYDKNGYLLGADFSVPLSVSKTRPDLWGVNPGRWVEFDGHIHWVTKDVTGKVKYNLYMMDPDVTAAGVNPEHPTAQDLVTLKKVTTVSEVVTVFHFPAVWDLVVWVKPNPNGAFADKNPTVKM
jgi:hypothetical protein